MTTTSAHAATPNGAASLALNPDQAPSKVLMSQVELSDFLQRTIGLKIKPKTLQKWRVTGDGPPFLKACSKIYYAPEPALEWARERMGPTRRSTSEVQQIAA
jgi:hypothetical protein